MSEKILWKRGNQEFPLPGEEQVLVVLEKTIKAGNDDREEEGEERKEGL